MWFKALKTEAKGENKLKRALLIAGCVLSIVLAASAQDDEAEFVQWMKATGTTAGSLRKNLEAKNGDAAAADARKLHGVFASVHGFYEKKKVTGATKFAVDSVAGFKEVEQMATAGKFEEASAALKKAMANCAGCHKDYREKAADGTYKFKY